MIDQKIYSLELNTLLVTLCESHNLILNIKIAMSDEATLPSCSYFPFFFIGV